MRTGPVTLFLSGDVMLGRGVDQILPHPGDPVLEEAFVRDARAYVRMAEDAHGSIPAPVDFSWPWGDALPVLEKAGPDARVVNLETSVTEGGAFWPGKQVHYRAHPANLPCLAEARPDVCSLANNHVMDFGYAGLADTLAALSAVGLRAAGAGRDAQEARAPVAVPVDGGGRVLVFAVGLASSGIPPDWAAGEDRPGVGLVSAGTGAADVVARVRRAREPGDVVVVSVHWGGNWGYDVSREVAFAHALVDGGVDVVHGHSSHMPRPIEVYRDRLVLYGCGDLVNDYEGIPGYEEYRDDLRLLYLASVEPGTGRLLDLRMVPLRARRMRLWRAPSEDVRWLRRRLTDVSARFGCVLVRDGEGLALRVGPTARPPGSGRSRRGRERSAPRRPGEPPVLRTGPAPAGTGTPRVLPGGQATPGTAAVAGRTRG
ncbi:CapA family protein [Nocardiopsis sp. YSL2]|uniref:CapA family protein n=1 Tax=Nocardiopsis sp. YSL2 TaxID=2939492 RepID=UPI0026F41766|nr:CapA family protein [Nocardiopsis sp. YSL2]